jgi:hypothetical protein
MPKAQMPRILTRQSRLGRLPAFAESPARKGGDECEKGIHRSLGEGGSASAGSAEDVKMPPAAARGGMATGDRGVARRAKTGGFGAVPLGFATDAPRGSAGSFNLIWEHPDTH